jgi:PhnB protein
MDFREGGRWLYSMIGPDNAPATRYSLAEYIEIRPKTSFTTKNSFSDENGNHVNSGFTFSITKYTFIPGVEKTTMQMAKKMASLAELEQFTAMGYKEGTAAGMNNLDEVLKTLVTSK